MNSTTDARGALRDLFQFHFGSHAWLPALLGAVAGGALVVLLGAILSDRPPLQYMPQAFRMSLVYRAVVSWAVSTLCAYAAGFVMGRLYVPRA
jgi:hypothetical protein